MSQQASTIFGTYTLSNTAAKTIVQSDGFTQISIQCTSALSITITGTLNSTTLGPSTAITLTNGQGITLTAQPGTYINLVTIDTSGGGSCIITAGQG